MHITINSNEHKTVLSLANVSSDSKTDFSPFALDSVCIWGTVMEPKWIKQHQVFLIFLYFLKNLKK